MNRDGLKLILSFVLVIGFFCSVYGAPKQKKMDIFCVGDSIVLGNRGTYIYSDILQSLFDKEYGANKVSVYNYSFFDMNTAQCLRLVRDLLSKQDSATEFIVIMAGEANFYNLNGFTDYLSSSGHYTPQEAFVRANDIDSVKKLNTGVASMYNSPQALSAEASLHYAFSAAYRSVAGNSPKKINGYSPKITPSFAVLAKDNMRTTDYLSFGTRYKAAWDFINEGKYKEAEALLKEMLRTNPFESGVYYTLGSLYLMEDGKKENEALKMFEEGILVRPFDKSNQCYKGLTVMYMSYEGRIISEILYFARVMKSYLGEHIPEINAITALNATDYDEKVATVHNWIISDIKKIDSLCKSRNVQLVVVDYPFDAKIRDFLRSTLAFSDIIFVNNSDILKDSEVSGTQGTAKVYIDTAKNVMDAISKKKIMKK